ncbi:plantaricin C family lantibiotic [Austwickia chelonae]|uniref:plantaricin C family lantibiotic n=1 Tax=Austwickia chelonae TaxID=100225 RepID=UPI000E2589DE
MPNDLSVLDANDASLLDEITEQDYAAVSGACSTNTFTLSNRYGNDGWFCTVTSSRRRSVNS